MDLIFFRCTNQKCGHMEGSTREDSYPCPYCFSPMEAEQPHYQLSLWGAGRYVS